MKPPTAEALASSLHPTHPKLAIDVLRAAGYTRGAARKAMAEGAATFAKEPSK
jgi:hypothetical protein